MASIVLATCAIALAKDFWEAKTYDQWAQRDCQKLLSNSPWAKELNLTVPQVNLGSESSGAMDSQPPYIKYTVQLRSALPVRQALVRQMQIVNKYDAMSAEDKKSFDQRFEEFLAGPPAGFVVAQVSFESNNQNHLQTLIRHWQSQTVDLLKNSVYLRGSKGEKASLAQYVPVEGGNPEFQFIFPREVDGKPVLAPGDKSLQLEFEYPVIEDNFGAVKFGDGKGFIEFKTDKMKLNGEVIY
ncbi:MAG: hypothetical protein LBT74_10225 [Acidobacteriota bacterium]|nr:hypothetical protein [Acidobacteriota bacterium]